LLLLLIIMLMQKKHKSINKWLSQPIPEKYKNSFLCFFRWILVRFLWGVWVELAHFWWITLLAFGQSRTPGYYKFPDIRFPPEISPNFSASNWVSPLKFCPATLSGL
jgi:hypothetical protein